MSAPDFFEADQEEREYWTDADEETIRMMRAWVLSAAVRQRILSARKGLSSPEQWEFAYALEALDELSESRLG